MRFDRSEWRKLYVLESPQHRLLSLFARGLRDYLLRFAEEDGTLIRGSKDPVRDLCRVIGAEPGERRSVSEAIKDLASVGYLTVEATVIRITRYVEAQTARSPGAKRQADYLARKRSDTGKRVTDDVTSDADGDVTGDVTREEKRREETTASPSQAGPCPAPLPLEASVLSGLELDIGIPRKVAEVNLQAWARQQSAAPSDRRTLGAWQKSGIAAIRGKWSDPSKRDEMRRLAEPQANPRRSAEDEAMAARFS